MNINEIIFHKISGSISPDEEKQLEQWLQATDEHRQQYEQLMDSKAASDAYRIYQRLDKRKAWAEFEREHLRTDRRARIVRLTRIALQTAAVVLILLGVGSLLYKPASRPIPPVVSQHVYQAIERSVQTGKSMAKVTIAGKCVNQQISMGEMLAQMTADVKANCEVETMNGKEFWITLDDGSRVHLNYNARLVYPTRFVGDTREVYLEGEAYFYVAKDSEHPFMVHTRNGVVKEYGTEFNVNAPKLGPTEVVLVNGSISVTPKSGNERMLKPEEKATFSEQGQVKIGKTDVTPYTAWNEGRFVFEDCTLDKLMGVLSKWYDVGYTFSSERLRNIHLSGTFDRYGSLQDILSAISSLTNVDMELHDGEIIIRNKH